MDRKKIMEAIVRKFNESNAPHQEDQLRDALKRIPDMDLVVFAQEIGIDTDAVLTGGK